MLRSAFALLLVAALAACGKPPRLEVDDAWTRASAGSAENAAVFMTIRSGTPDRLIGASTTAANKTDLMTMESDEGAMSMKYLDAIDIPANQPVSLDPTGLHVWLAGLDEPLRAGQTFALILEFEKAGEQRVEVTVIEPAAPPPMSEMGM